MDFEGSFGPFGEKNVIWPVTVSSVKSKSHPVVQERKEIPPKEQF